ncbi:hypothetical protein BJ742DRAFT_453673 [Cladochytrium replicatum]|nr:hypothetical protein BJ742DRAFT_453673 [Cladochytrium replicatum]
MVTVQLCPLPDAETYLYGFYGLETCYIRGLVRLENKARKQVIVEKLRVSVQARTACNFMHRSDNEVMHRTRIHLNMEEVLFYQPEVLAPQSLLEIPFEILLPESVPDPQATAAQTSMRLNPPSYYFRGVHPVTGQNYESRMVYELTAELVEPPEYGGFVVPKPKVSTIELSPWVSFDPRLIPRIMFPDAKRWRSAPESSPVEYDIEISSIVLGPSDTLKFNYRIAIARDVAREGVRIKRVRLVMREHHYVGDTRGIYVRGVRELFRWVGEEVRPQESDGSYELAEFRPSGKEGILRARLKPAEIDPADFIQAEPSHAGGSGSDSRRDDDGQRIHRGGTLRGVGSWLSSPSTLARSGAGGGDGLYAEEEVLIKIPPRGSFTPTLNKPVDAYRTPLHLTPPAHVEVKHSMQVVIELTDTSPVHLECGCILASVGQDDCIRVLEETPEIMPRLDYDKVTGGEAWIPAYAKNDPLIAELLAKERAAEEGTPSASGDQQESTRLSGGASSSEETQQSNSGPSVGIDPLRNDEHESIFPRTSPLLSVRSYRKGKQVIRAPFNPFLSSSTESEDSDEEIGDLTRIHRSRRPDDPPPYSILPPDPSQSSSPGPGSPSSLPSLPTGAPWVLVQNGSYSSPKPPPHRIYIPTLPALPYRPLTRSNSMSSTATKSNPPTPLPLPPRRRGPLPQPVRQTVSFDDDEAVATALDDDEPVSQSALGSFSSLTGGSQMRPRPNAGSSSQLSLAFLPRDSSVSSTSSSIRAKLLSEALSTPVTGTTGAAQNPVPVDGWTRDANLPTTPISPNSLAPSEESDVSDIVFSQPLVEDMDGGGFEVDADCGRVDPLLGIAVEVTRSTGEESSAVELEEAGKVGGTMSMDEKGKQVIR